MKRRNVLQGLGIAPLAIAPAEIAKAKSNPGLTIDRLDVFRVRVNRLGNWVIPRLTTRSGVSGLGDASQSLSEPRTLAFLKQFSELLRGRSAFDVEWFRRATAATVFQDGGGYGRTSAAVAASALEQCLWDIKGKALSLPAYELFGGRIQERLRVYANINRSTEDRAPEGFAGMAQKAVAAGFDAIKLAPFDDMPHDLAEPERIEHFTGRGIACAEAVRQVIGPDKDLLVDAHSHFNLKQGLELARRFEPLNLYWLEEVTRRTPVEDLAAINRAAKMSTAGGEGIQGVRGFYPYIKAEAVDIVMPDVKVCGGMLELKKISALAEGAGLLSSPHGPASPIGNAAAAHVMASVPNFEIFELSFGEVPWRSELVDPPEMIEKGGLVLTARPGLGHTLNEKIVTKYSISS